MSCSSGTERAIKIMNSLFYSEFGPERFSYNYFFEKLETYGNRRKKLISRVL